MLCPFERMALRNENTHFPGIVLSLWGLFTTTAEKF